MTAQDKSACGGNGHEPIQFNGAYLRGHDKWGPEEMKEILERYDILIEERMYKNAIALEKEEGYPYTWLNWILSSHNLTREGLKSKVDSETIKSEEAKR